LPEQERGDQAEVEPPIVRDAEELLNEKAELLYEYARWSFDGEMDRFDRIDRKISWYLTASVILLGLSANWAETAMDISCPPVCLVQWALLLSSILFVIVVGAAILLLTSALKGVNSEVIAPPVDEDVPKAFDEHKLAEVSFSLGRYLLNATRENTDLSDQKLKRAALGFYFVRITIVLFLLALILYAFINLVH